MSKPRSFTDLEQTTKKKLIRREIFLAEMDKVMPWDKLETAIEGEDKSIAVMSFTILSVHLMM